MRREGDFMHAVDAGMHAAGPGGHNRAMVEDFALYHPKEHQVARLSFRVRPAKAKGASAGDAKAHQAAEVALVRAVQKPVVPIGILESIPKIRLCGADLNQVAAEQSGAIDAGANAADSR